MLRALAILSLVVLVSSCQTSRGGTAVNRSGNNNSVELSPATVAAIGAILGGRGAAAGSIAGVAAAPLPAPPPPPSTATTAAAPAAAPKAGIGAVGSHAPSPPDAQASAGQSPGSDENLRGFVLSPRPPVPPPISQGVTPAGQPPRIEGQAASLQIAPPPPKALPKRAGKNGQYDVVRVFFGTDRVVMGSTRAPRFGSQRGPILAFGSVDVSIPPHHVTGVVESPSLWKLEFQRDPTRDVTILQVALTPYSQFRAEMRSQALNAPTPSVLLFIHGYNVSFEDAAMRTAQMAHDLQFAGAPVFFSWPSRGNLAGYFDDEAAIERAQDDIQNFVTQVLAATPGANLYVIAHSMGNRGMTRALVNFARAHPDEAGRIREVILAAPDIDTDVFVNQIAPGLVAIGAPVTLYASSTDHALRISEAIHGGPRAGDSGDSLVLLRGIETIDVSNVDTDLTGHSYVGDQRTILSDLYYIIQNDTRASRRFGLTREVRNGSEYWVFNR
ncbi:alpha/beta hydrolase [Paraburkholderia sp. BR10882]|uniref:alpha/beta hydrolase n=1 Tax=unclassified Paraburkholderia TaxID=2615204 RepID=UPI0034CF5D1E